jgi:hypothetical protein
MENELRPFWRKLFNFDWKFGLFLILIVYIPRFILVLNANASGNNSSVGLIMAISAVEHAGISTTYRPVFEPKKWTFKERVMQKYLKLKAARSQKKARLFIAAGIFLALAIVLTFAARKSNQSSPPNGFTGTNDGCLKAVLAILSFGISVVLFIVALVTSV